MRVVLLKCKNTVGYLRNLELGIKTHSLVLKYPYRGENVKYRGENSNVRGWNQIISFSFAV